MVFKYFSHGAFELGSAHPKTVFVFLSYVVFVKEIHPRLKRQDVQRSGVRADDVIPS